MKKIFQLLLLFISLPTTLVAITCNPNLINPVAGSPFGTGGANPGDVRFYFNGQFLSAVNRVSATVTVFSVGQNGVAVPIAGSPFATITAAPLTVDYSLNGKFLVTAHTVGVVMFSVAVNGALTRLGLTAAGTSSLGAQFSPNSEFLAVANSGSDDVTVFSVASTGGLTPVTDSPFSTLPGTSPQSVAYSFDGKLLVTANGNGTVTLFSVAADGSLTFLGTATVGTSPTSAQFSPNNKFIAVVNSGSNDVTMLRVAADGTLTIVDNVAVGTDPRVAKFSTDGTLLAVSIFGASAVSLFKVSNGQLTPDLTVATGGTSPLGLDFSPGGNFLALANFNSANVSIFCLNQSNLALCVQAIRSKYQPICPIQ